MVEVSYDAVDPQQAEYFINTLTDEFIAHNVDMRWQMNRQTREWIDNQLEDLRKTLAASEDALRAYATQSGLVILDEKNNVSEDKLRRLQEELTRARADRIEKEARYAIAKSASPESIPELLKDDLFKDYQSKLAALHQQRAELSTAYTPEYSKVKRITAQIASLESAMTVYRNAQIDRIRNQYEEAVGREKLLMDNYGEETQNLIQEGTRTIQYGMLKREVDSNRQLYDAMLQRTKEAGMASAMKASNVKVIDAAVPPSAPSSPVMALNAAIGLVGSVMLSMLVIAVRERGGAIRRPGELRTFLSVVELGTIRSAKHGILGYGRRAYASAAAVSSHSSSGRLISSAPHRRAANALIASATEYSAMAQSIQSVLASISFSDTRRKPGVVVVTSPNAGEGKTTVATNLAVSLAAMHERVLLIDGDMHVPGLFLLTAGTKRTSTLFQSPTLMRLIAEARGRFKAIVIDTPPLFEFADARVLGRCADGVILIART
jgi:hypothetical protein